MEIGNNELPLGLGMALAQNLTAMEKFTSLSTEQKSSVISKAGSVSSKNEMRALVSELAGGSIPGVY